MNNQLLYSLLPTISGRAKKALSKQERNRAFLKSYLFTSIGGAATNPVTSFLISKEIIEKEITLNENKRLRTLADQAGKDHAAGEDGENSARSTPASSFSPSTGKSEASQKKGGA